MLDEKEKLILSTTKDVIMTIRGYRVILDSDLAKLYGTKTKRLNEQVKRNKGRFPNDFMFQLTSNEKQEVVAFCDHLKNLKYSSKLPYAFTEHGAVMVANIINNEIAINASILVVRAFIRAREIISEHFELQQRLTNLEIKVARGFSANEQELQAIRFAIHQLMKVPKKTNKKPIGFKLK